MNKLKLWRKRLVQKFSKKLLYDIFGFTDEITQKLPDKYIIALAPHTSNWDFIIGILYGKANRVNCNFLMKKEWFFWPMGKLMRRLGGIPVYRDKHHRATDIIAEQAKQKNKFCLCITPEGTRKANPDWKKGFYYIALKADLPIFLYGLDYGKRKIICTKKIIPNGDIETQMKEIKEYYKPFKAKYPRKFIITNEIDC